MTTRPIADALFTTGPQPVLFGGRHRTSGRVVFPCPAGAEGDDFEKIALPRHGTLWSWTIQRFRPKSPPYQGPAIFEPFALGYVELADQLIVQSRLTGIAWENLRIGMKLVLTTFVFDVAADGKEIALFAFGPAAEQRA